MTNEEAQDPEWEEELVRRAADGDDGVAASYYFVVLTNPDFSFGGEFHVALTPVKYWKQEGCQSDWELDYNDADLDDQCMESDYAVENTGLPQHASYQALHDHLAKSGLRYSHAFAAFMNEAPLGPEV